MTCVICKSGTPEAGKTTVTLERDKTLIVFRRVPAKTCPNCGAIAEIRDRKTCLLLGQLFRELIYQMVSSLISQQFLTWWAVLKPILDPQIEFKDLIPECARTNENNCLNLTVFWLEFWPIRP